MKKPIDLTTPAYLRRNPKRKAEDWRKEAGQGAAALAAYWGRQK